MVSVIGSSEVGKGEYCAKVGPAVFHWGSGRNGATLISNSWTCIPIENKDWICFFIWCTDNHVTVIYMIEKYGTILNVENELIHTFTVFKLHFKAAKQWFIPNTVINKQWTASYWWLFEMNCAVWLWLLHLAYAIHSTFSVHNRKY